MNKQRIFILSPQHWGTMFLSKHHYAIEFAKMGNEVFFLIHPNQHGRLEKANLMLKKQNFKDYFWLINN